MGPTGPRCGQVQPLQTDIQDNVMTTSALRAGDTGIVQKSHTVLKLPTGRPSGRLSVSSSNYGSISAFPKLVSEVNQELLTSGAVILPGRRQVTWTQSIVLYCTETEIAVGGQCCRCAPELRCGPGESCTVNDLTCLLGYYYSTLRKERCDQGLSVVIDSRRQQPVPALLSSLSELQALVPNALYSVLFLVDKEGTAKPERDINVQTETLSSLKAVLKHIDQTQLTRDLEGTFHYDHNHWIHFRQKIEPFASSCSAAISSLQESISTLSNSGNLKTSKEVSEVLEQQRHLMKDAVDMLNALYNQVDEEVHKLVILSNKSQKQLESLLEVRKFEEQTQQIKLWFSGEGEKQLTALESLTLSAAKIKEMRESLEQFLEESVHQQRHGLQLVKESPESLPGSALLDFKHHLGSILSRVERRKAQLDILTNLYEFYDFSVRLSSSVVQVLQDYYTEASKFSMDNFSTLNDMVLSSGESSAAAAVEHNRRMPDRHYRTGGSKTCVLLPVEIAPLTFEDKPHSAGPFSKSPTSSISSSSHFIFPPDCDGKLRQSPSMFDDTDSDCTIDSTISCHSEPVYSGNARLRKQPLKKIMKKTMSYELTPRDSGHSDVSHIHGYTGVYIKGLEVANNVAAEKKLQRPDVTSPALGRSRSMSTPSRVHNRRSDGDGMKQSSKVQHIMDEMISTEREYVRSLSYIIEHYFPEMERLDLPQDLRGKRSIIFGNVEKLWDFHSQYFMKDLESSAHSPLSISSCFLRHEDQFGMYALYSKNKPQSDTLLCSHGNEFFKNKQMELGDKMDLASYLLKPIQRMSKYALLLKDLIKECSQSQEQELSDLRTAEEMVKFQLRHGNDLLAMDAIRGCDVNLKEQGQLRCQDEFIVWCGRRKYLRHVFLFEDLILFSKTKKIEGGYDIYIYKQSFKTAEIGMTENVGDSGLRFEIWFRRRKSQDTFILQASSAEVKAVWTAIIGKILWRQALRNRALRMQEMVSMGIGSKPFMDIKPSDAAISDRAIDYIMKGSESRTRASIAVPSFEYATSFKRPHSTISNSSTSSSSSQSSSSLLGSLNLHLYSSPSHPHTHALTSVPSFAQWPYDCIEEDELEQDTGSQPSMITESSETSSQCTSSESVTGLSTLTIPDHPSIVMDSFNNNEPPSFLCSSTPSSSITSPSVFQKEEDLQSPGTKFITAVSVRLSSSLSF
ncbi:Pleckstrin -like proteiny domain-containing family G member 4B [Collichthys lucidus]|uniref:Pleckstrin-like proteiny domain-containing family G member 4B n=1 Tax=Collichthys lucidus TaxID=240159 RepID=A0A4U5V3C6_COLLU|nr:Pleckstrin -like proteiny domain-containing family G member 4B [Collichthys lucidus]